MKNFLQNLLIVFALALCGLIAFQWVRETDLRKNVQKLNDNIHDHLEKIQALDVNIKRDEAEIQRLDGLKNQLTQTVKSNVAQISLLTRDLEKATNETNRLNGQVAAYKAALETANDSIKKQNEDIKKQNEDMAKLAEDRNEVVKKFNALATNYTDLATKWNKQQEDLAKAATNAPAKKVSASSTR